MKYLHTMVRVSNLEESLKFYVDSLGLVEVNRYDVEAGRFTLVFLAAAGDEEAQIELTYNWDPEDYPGRRYLSDMSAIDGRGGNDQPTAAGRTHGIRALARGHLDRTLAEGRFAPVAGALAVHAEHRGVVASASARPKVRRIAPPVLDASGSDTP